MQSSSLTSRRAFGLASQLAMAVVLLVGATLGAPSQAAAVGGETFVSLTNDKRAEAGKSPVSESAALDQISVERANTLARTDDFVHDLAYVQRRLAELGQCSTGVGEIIAWERGYPSYSYSRTIRNWWESTGHHAIMVGDYNAAGGSWARSSASGTIYSVMIFARLCEPPTPATTAPSITIRISGTDRYSTAAAVSARTFGPGVGVAVLATGQSFPDALAGGPYAARYGGPLLLVTRDSIPTATATELARLHPARIVVLGGTASVSDAVMRAADGYTAGSVSRIAGRDRYAVAAAISAAAFVPDASVAFVATGATFADALSGGALAARGDTPVLLVTRDSIPAATATELRRLNPGRIIVLGGTASVGSSVAAALDGYTNGAVSRLSGGDRYSTAAAISAAGYATNGPDTVYISTGGVFPDGLSAGPVAGRDSDPVLLVQQTSVPTAVATELKRLNPSHVVVVGGPMSVSNAVIGTIDDLLR